jgi:predicted RNA-binding Zn-ribbon protein involved in translation (DUF1610 family)
MIDYSNCGSEDAPFEIYSLKYECPDCGHTWENDNIFEGRDNESLYCPEYGSSDCEETGDG